MPYAENTDRYLLLYGGRGSGKSDFATKKILYALLFHKYFRGIMIRKHAKTVYASCFQSLKDIIVQSGATPFFRFNESRMSIECILNNNKIMAAGLDDPTKIKSIKDPTFVWWEEDIPDEDDFITVTTSIRTLRGDYLQEIFSVNPEVEGQFEENWFWKKYFKDRVEKSFRGVTLAEIKPGIDFEVPYTVHHSTYQDNGHLPDEYRALLESMKTSNPYYYTIYTLGDWGNKVVEGRFYKLFDKIKTVKPTKYNSEEPLHISFDFNVHPYMSCIISQVEGKKVEIIDEITAKEPDNTSKGIAQIINRKYARHEAKVYVYGDPAGRHEDTRTEKGTNDFTIIEETLKLRNSRRVDLKAPSVSTRGDFINEIFHNNLKDIEIAIDPKCQMLINDLLMCREQSDGTKFKEKTTDKDTGVRYEKYGHLSDCLDYLIIRLFKEEYNDFKGGGAFDYLVGSRAGSFSY